MLRHAHRLDRKARPRIRKTVWFTLLKLTVVVIILPGFTGCTAMFTNRLIEPITLSLQRQRDLELLNDGIPSLLLMLDGFIAADPNNKKLLIAGIQAYTSYANSMYEQGREDRAADLSSTAKGYSLTLLKLTPGFNYNLPASLGKFKWNLFASGQEEVAALFWGGYGWATWIGFQNGSPAAIADLPKVEQIMLRVLELDEKFYYGAAHLFLGYYYGSRPEILGGKFKESRKHFERALEISNREFLLTQVAYAESYARMTFNRKLYKDLLTEVLSHPLDDTSELSFSNQLAKLRAQKLLDHIDAYF